MCMFRNTPLRKFIKKPKKAWKYFRVSAYPARHLEAPYVGHEQPILTWLTATNIGHMGNCPGFYVFRYRWMAKSFGILSDPPYVLLPVQVQGKVYGVGLTGFRVDEMFIPEPAGLNIRKPVVTPIGRTAKEIAQWAQERLRQLNAQEEEEKELTNA